MTTLANIFGKLASEREYAARERRYLLEQAADFEKELANKTQPWTSQNDPLTERPWLAIEDASEGVPWRKRVRLFNRHFLEFVITDDGRFYLCTSDGIHKHYEHGLTMPSPATRMELRLEYKQGDSKIGTPLAMVLEEHIERLANLPNLQSDDDSEVDGR